jgi:hypothetical protein
MLDGEQRPPTEGVLGILATSYQDVAHLMTWLNGVRLAIMGDPILPGKIFEFLPSCGRWFLSTSVKGRLIGEQLTP